MKNLGSFVVLLPLLVLMLGLGQLNGEHYLDMGKRSSFDKLPRDYYPTPEKAVAPLLDHLPREISFCEPCAGDGRLVSHLEKYFDAVCFFACDTEPNADWIIKKDANKLNSEEVEWCEMIITNPPFTWKTLKPLMDVFLSLRPTILLLPADYMHNQRMSHYMKLCSKVVSIGRLKWIEDSPYSGVDNYCWYWFDKDNKQQTEFYGSK